MSETSHLDSAALERLRRLGGDAFTLQMIKLFIDYGQKKLAEARQAESAGNLAGLQSAVHPLKSSAGNVGAVQVQQLASRIEALARQNQGDALKPLLTEIEDEFALVKVELEARQQELEPPTG